MKTKRIGAIFLCMMMVLCTSVYTKAQDNEVSVIVNGTKLDEKGTIFQDRTLVPMRAICEAMGVQVDWLDKDGVKTVTISKDLNESDSKIMKTSQIKYCFTIGSKIAKKVNNGANITLNVAPQIIDGKTMLPARDMADVLGCSTQWDSNTHTATIKDESRKYCVLQDGVLTIFTKYSSENDFYIILKKKGANQLFDFYSGGLISNNTLGVKTALNDKKALFENNNDWFGAFHMTAKNNVDGDDLTGGTWTGGAHSYQNTQQGDPTARCTNLQFWVDDKEVTQYEGYFDKLRIEWSNNVQATNTKKIDGTGREVLCETHDVIFDGEKFDVSNDIMPLEDINMNMYYSFQCCLPGYRGMLTYYGDNGIKDATVSATESSKSESHNCARASAMLDGNCVEVGIDTSYGLGKRDYTAATNAGMFCDGGKIRTHLIYDKDLKKDTHYYSKGYFKFYSE